MNRRCQFWLLPLVLSTAGVLSLTPYAHAEKKKTILRKVTVKEVTGDVLAWLPWASAWQKINEDTVLWESTLVQVRPRASITFTLAAEAGFDGLRADSVEITLKTPTVTRLESGVLRKVALNNFFVPQIPDIQEGAPSTTMMFKKLNEAWDRFAALVVQGQVKQKWIDAAEREPNDEDASMKAKSKKIRILTPKNEMMALSEQFPVELTILWQKLDEPGLSYDVMVWKLDEPRRPPLAVTRFDYHYAKLFSEGTYYIQVGTSDGRYQSAVHQVHVSLPLQGRKNENGAASAKPNAPLSLLLPPNHFSMRTRTIPATVTFSWERALGKREQRYQVVITDLAGKEVVRKSTTERLLRLRLPNAGEYRWYVEAEPDQATSYKAGKKVFSETRLLTIDASGPSATDPYVDFLLKRHEGLLYAEDLGSQTTQP